MYCQKASILPRPALSLLAAGARAREVLREQLRVEVHAVLAHPQEHARGVHLREDAPVTEIGVQSIHMKGPRNEWIFHQS